MPKSYRIRTEVGQDKYINVNLEQDWESLEILSLKILANDLYTRFCADYGVVVGRVFVNNGFGLPNAKVSVFIPLEEADELNPVISELYPYKSITDTNEEGYRYNLLPKLPSYNGHTSTGSFPNKADVLMDNSYIEVYDKYYRFTVTTNESGDFMIFGVPVGTQTIVMDVDLSDIGCFSLAPQDLIQQGLATETQVNGARFKSSTNLRELPQIKNLVFDVDVRPFWGDAELCQVGITRVDFDLTKQANINIQPTAIFMGSIISTTDDDALKVKCKPKNNTGNLCELVAGPGEIQAIRQTIFSDVNGLPILERYEIEEGGKVIDDNGTYLLNVPMNLDYVFTNEFGQQVISNDPTKGIPTKGKYRFKFKWQNEQGLQGSFLRADFLVPNVKEYGWINSNTDPFDPNNAGTYNYTLAAGQISGFTAVIPQNVGFASPQTTNVESYQILINGQVYLGSIESIQLNSGDQFQIIATPVNPSSPQTILFTSYPQDLFDVYKSYAFSTDWDDYANAQDAIDCEDTFYEFKYNKVYTTAMFLDRYKNGIGRAKHLGIKEIDNRSCKSTVNTFPVNDIIRNFDFIFFVFNILINILTFPILTLLFVAHLIALLWPILKYLLLFLGPLIVYFGVSAGIDLGYYILSLTNVTAVGPVISPATVLQIIAQGAKTLFLTAAGLAFTYFYTKFFINNTANGRIDNFPRIGLPMIAYPDCTSCDCECGNASLDDDFDANSIQQEIQDAQNGLSGGGTGSYDLETTQPSSLIAPLNTPQSYNVSHPNLELNSNGDEPFDCGVGFGGKFESFTTLIGNDDVSSDVVVRAVLDFQRMFSGYDVLSSTDPNKYIQNEAYLLKAPQPFLFSAKKNGNNPPDSRYFAFPTSVTLAQKLNEFNTRDKYFYNNTSNTPNTGINKIKTWVNPTINNLSTAYLDQVVVVLMNPGTTATLGVGNLITFQDPTFTGTSSTNRLVNLTGATTNQFSNNAITGTTITGTTSVTVTYANPSNPSGGIPTTFDIISPQVSQIADPTNPSVEQSYLQYATDIEYFQLITGMTYSDFNSININTSGYFPETFLRHNIDYIRPNCNLNGFIQETYSDVITFMSDYQNYEVCIFVRGVDPFTAKQTIKYDLSHIFGYTTLNQQVTVEGEYYLNIPIQPNQIKPQSHNTVNNNNAILYHPSYTFTIDPSNYTGFTSELPYYYLSTDDTLSSLYTPVPSLWSNNSNSTISLNQTLINGSNMPLLPPFSFYTVGGTYFRWNSGTNYTLPTNIPPAELFTQGNSSGCDQDCQKQQYYNHPSAGGSGNGPYFTSQAALTATYSPAYYRYTLPGVNFSNSNNIVMRSDRLPTSTGTQNGAGSQTGFGLHQNDNFTIYAPGGNNAPPQIFVGGDLANGESFDLDPNTEALTSTLTCEGMVPLACYSGSGQNVGVLPSTLCSVPSNRMINGCYCLLNKKYVKEYGDDVRLFLEWKVRFTMNFAACRGVFAQVFQNNWVNGVLYMFNFNKQTTFNIQAQPNYDYCQDVILYNDISNTFYYRSSPWNENTQQFVGKNSPTANPNLPQSFLDFPGLGYNQKQIQFPTTVVDLGPRDYFINEICCSGIDGFGSYYADQLKSTSYQDNSDIIQLGFLSRILNEGVRQRILPISNGGNNSEGKGIVQFFNSTRGGYRIDGDWSQMLSINSEWKVSPFITENIPAPNYIYFGDNQNGTTGQINSNDIKPIMGLFFSSNTNEERYRKIMSPGIETYNFNPLIEEKFGYSKSQEVPHYRWTISLPQNSAGTPNIFGSEDNNWYTNTFPTGFTKKRYQDLDFTSPQEKYITPTTRFGFISNFLNNNPNPSSAGVIQGQPVPVSSQGIPTGPNALQSVVVGAPYHFYFGLNNGKTAINRFYKLYVATTEE